jgi:hypothetical protein
MLDIKRKVIDFVFVKVICSGEVGEKRGRGAGEQRRELKQFLVFTIYCSKWRTLTFSRIISFSYTDNYNC